MSAARRQPWYVTEPASSAAGPTITSWLVPTACGLYCVATCDALVRHHKAGTLPFGISVNMNDLAETTYTPAESDTCFRFRRTRHTIRALLEYDPSSLQKNPVTCVSGGSTPPWAIIRLPASWCMNAGGPSLYSCHRCVSYDDTPIEERATTQSVESRRPTRSVESQRPTRSAESRRRLGPGILRDLGSTVPFSIPQFGDMVSQVSQKADEDSVSIASDISARR
jgi:hypothetical protein